MSRMWKKCMYLVFYWAIFERLFQNGTWNLLKIRIIGAMIFFDLNVIFFQCRFYLLWTSWTSDSEAMVGMKRHPVTSQTPLFCWAAADLKLYWTGHGHHKQRNLLLLQFVGCNLKSHPKYWIWYDLLFLKTQPNFFFSSIAWNMNFAPNILKIF